jgi:glutaredoxin 3
MHNRGMSVTVYTKKPCPYCVRAAGLLYKNGVKFEVIDLTGNPQGLAELQERSGMSTLPQVFHDGQLIGGYDQLKALHDERGLAHLKS